MNQSQRQSAQRPDLAFIVENLKVTRKKEEFEESALEIEQCFTWQQLVNKKSSNGKDAFTVNTELVSKVTETVEQTNITNNAS